MDRTLCFIAIVVVVLLIAIVMAWSVRRVSARRDFADVPVQPLVLVVGAGLAGLTAAISVAPHATVVVAEQALHVGGNSARAKSGIARPVRDTPAHRRAMLNDLLRAARTKDTDEHVRAMRLVDEATAAHDWVREVLRVQLTEVRRTGGHSEARTYSTPNAPVGAKLIEHAVATAKELGVTICTGRRMEDIYTHHDGDGVVVSFADEKGARKQQRCDAVVIATGGYAHPDSEALKNAAPELASLPTTNGTTSAVGGRVHELLHRRLGARLRNLDRVQVHPTALVDPANPTSETKELLAEAVRGMGAQLVDENGKRFVDELRPRDEVVAAMRESGSKRFYVLLPRGAKGESLVKKYIERGLFVAFDDSPLSAIRGIDRSALVAEVTPALHYTMGGIAVDVDGRVLGSDGAPIPGVYAAGETTGGLHGHNRLAGNSLLECVVYGRIVARTLITDMESREPRGLDISICDPRKKDPPALAQLVGTPKAVSLSEVAAHNSRSAGLWIVIDQVVYDVTGYVDRHPNGSESIVAVAGTDATEVFKMHHHQGLSDGYLINAILSETVKVVGALKH